MRINGGEQDPIISLIEQEQVRQQNTISLIASENYASQAVLQATGSVLTNKYAEGYPAKRYYAGCEVVDAIETLAIERCKNLFNAEHANVQAHCGSSANMAAYQALIKPGDTILGMSLSGGGHLTHGHGVNFSGIVYKSVQYGVQKETELLDYEDIYATAQSHKPALIVCGASAYSRTIDFKKFAEIAQSVGAYLIADIAHIAGLIAADLHPTPVPYADMVTSTTHKTLRGPRGAFVLSKASYAEVLDKAVMPGIQGGPFMHVIAAKGIAFQEAMDPSFKTYQKNVIAHAQAMVAAFKSKKYRVVADGTDNHLFILDLRSKGITGKQAETVLEKAGITVTRSCIPFDTAKPWIGSGIRIGTPALTTRGCTQADAEYVVQLIDDALMNNEDENKLRTIKQQVAQLCAQYKL